MSKQRLVALAIGLFSITSCFSTAPVSAGMLVGEWWDGSWRCKIDGRPARMVWTVVDDPQSTSNGGIGTTTSNVKRIGRFSDNGSPWVSLSDARKDNKGGLFFRHADGNQWYLPNPQGGKTSGWTTWQGKRYSLVCRR